MVGGLIICPEGSREKCGVMDWGWGKGWLGGGGG